MWLFLDVFEGKSLFCKNLQSSTRQKERKSLAWASRVLIFHEHLYTALEITTRGFYLLR